MTIALSTEDAVFALAQLFEPTSSHLERHLMEYAEVGKNAVQLLDFLSKSKKHWAGMRMGAPGKLENLDIFKRETRNLTTALRSCGVSWTACGHSDYPERLSSSRSVSPWPILFYRGNPSLMNENVIIGIVGTRNPSAEAINAVKSLASILVSEGSVILSGNAQGIDSSAHSGAFSASGASIYVIPDDISRFKPRCDPDFENKTGQWLALSPWLPGAPVHKGRFIERNSLLADLCDALVIGEVGAKSGAFYTLRSARKRGIPLFFLCDDSNKPYGLSEYSLASLGAKSIKVDKENVNLIIQSIRDDQKQLKSSQNERSRLNNHQQGEIFE